MFLMQELLLLFNLNNNKKIIGEIMTTKKQNKANQKNAVLSTGPITEDGKAVVCLNAIKHGIFAKDLIVNSGIGKENEKEYYELLNNLIDCLNPNNQFENLLVEKISIDFWRLRRVIRFETGSIKNYINEIIKDYYDPYKFDQKKKTNEELDKEIEEKRNYVDWNNQYIECLKKGIVSFDKSSWVGKNIKSDIEEDFYILANTLDRQMFSEEEYRKLKSGECNLSDLRIIFDRAGFSDLDISNKLITCFLEQNEDLENEIEELEQKKASNIIADELNAKICSLPPNDSFEKVLKYEKSIQKSIFQNIFLLKKLQNGF